MRALARITRTLRSGDSFIEGRFQQLGPTQPEIWLSDCLEIPTYFVGFFEEAGKLAGARDPRVQIVSREGPALRLRFEWR